MSEKRYRVVEAGLDIETTHYEIASVDRCSVFSFDGMDIERQAFWARDICDELNNAYAAGQRHGPEKAPEPEQPVDEVPEGYEVWHVELARDGERVMARNPRDAAHYIFLDCLHSRPRFVRLYGYRIGRTLRWFDQDRAWRDKEGGTVYLTPCGCGSRFIEAAHIEGAESVLPDAVLMRKGDC